MPHVVSDGTADYLLLFLVCSGQCCCRQHHCSAAVLLVTLLLQPTVVLWGASDPWEPVGRAKEIFEGFVADFVELPGGYVWTWGAWGRCFVGTARCDSSNSMMARRVGPSKEQGRCSAPLMATAMSASACK